jgi:hypothetical protein
VPNETPGRVSKLHSVGVFIRRGTCSETLFEAVNYAYGRPAPQAEHACAPLAGGIMMHGYQCGQVWGAALAAGAAAYRRFGSGPAAETAAVAAAKRAVEAFRAQNGHVDCFDLTDFDEKKSKLANLLRLFLKGGPAKCLGMAARFPPVAVREIEAALAAPPSAAPSGPVSCAALVARRMGATEGEAVTVAGLAGGIGLCGGGCGALGAAIWLTLLRRHQDGLVKVPMKHPESEALVERFLKCTNYEFECSTIAGRTFDSVADHAAYVAGGGCAKILETLAGTTR